MTVTIKPGVDLTNIKQRLGVGDDEELRESEKRRRYLQGFARLITPLRPSLRLTTAVPTAMVNQARDDDPEMYVTSRDFDQPATQYSQQVFDLIMQEALTVHEIGHILYTDHRDFKSYLSKVEMGRKSMFKRIWNTLEDAAIEEQLRREYDVADEILIMNANLFEADEIGHAVGEGDPDADDVAMFGDEHGDTSETQELRFSFFQAVILGLLDMGVYDSGKFAKLRDPDNDRVLLAEDADRDLLDNFVPELKSVVRDVKTMSDSHDRNARIWVFWQELVDQMADAQNSGENQSNLSDLLGDDGTVSNDDSAGGGSGGDGDDDGEISEETDAEPMQGKPDDTENEMPGDAGSAYELDMDQTAEDVAAQVEMAAGDEIDADAGEQGDDTDGDAGAETDAGDTGDDHPGAGDGQATGGEQDESEPETAGNDAASDEQDGGGSGGADVPRLRPDELQSGGGGDEQGDSDESDGDAASDERGSDADGDAVAEASAGQPAAEAGDDQSGDDQSGDEQAAGDESAGRDADREAFYQQELASEAAELDGGDELLDEIEQFAEIIEDAERNTQQGGKRGGAGFSGLTLDVPSPQTDGDADKWSTVKRRGRRIARILRNRLQENQQNRPKRRQKKGQFDRRQMIPAERGDPRVFQRTQEDRTKDYDGIIVLDRSGSMRGDIDAAEIACGTLAYAFQLLGINVCVMDLLASEARLAHAFGQDVEQTRSVLLSGASGGGTPLSKVLHLARKRVANEESNPFMVVVTDGRPANHDQYREELDNCTFPVLGVYLGADRGTTADDESVFHEQVYVGDAEDVDTAMTNLAEAVIDPALVDLSRGVSF